MQEKSSHNAIWFLIARTLSGEATREEESRLQHLLRENASLQQQYELLRRMWSSGHKQMPSEDDENEVQHITKILQLAKLETQDYFEAPVMPVRPRKRIYVVFATAAAVMLLIVGYSFLSSEHLPAIPAESVKELTAQNGSRTRTILPDGSTVWLNAGSHVTFKENFTGNTREVTLDGEAYFDVVKNPQKPFIVHVGGYDIKVLGTAFNVKSYPPDKTVETTLIRGLVQVTRQGESKESPIFLRPNEKLILDKMQEGNSAEAVTPEKNPDKKLVLPFAIETIDSSVTETELIETAWVYNRLQFRGESFADLALKLERWYNVKIVFEDEAVQKLNFNGSFEKETVEQALVALRTATPFRFSIKDNIITIGSYR